MKKTLTLIIILIFNHLNIFSQSFLLTKNGDKFECKLAQEVFESEVFEINKKEKKNVIEIKTNGERKNIKYEDIYGYYSNPLDKFYYFKKCYIKKLDNRIFQKEKTSNNENYFFTERILEGEIKLYKKRVYFQSMGITMGNRTMAMSGSTAYYDFYFIEKNKLFLNVISKTGFLKFKSEGYKRINEIFKDSLIIQKIDSKKHDHKLLQDIITKYNLNNFSSIKNEEIKNKGKIIFYRESKKQNKKPITILINNQKVVLNTNEIKSIELDYKQHYLIKFENTSNDLSVIVKPNKFYNLLYNVNYNKKLEVELNQKNQNSSYTKARIRYIQKKMKKH